MLQVIHRSVFVEAGSGETSTHNNDKSCEKFEHMETRGFGMLSMGYHTIYNTCVSSKNSEVYFRQVLQILEVCRFHL